MKYFAITLPCPPSVLGGNGRGGWRGKHHAFQQVKRDAGLMMRDRLAKAGLWPFPEPVFTGVVTLSVEWSTPNRAHFPDVDQLVARLKPILDAAQEGNIYANDRQVELGAVTRVVGPRQVTVTFSGE